MRIFVLAGFLFMCCLTGCGGGGGGGETAPDAPIISNLSLTPLGDGTIDIHLEFTDSGGNISALTGILYDGAGAELENVTVEITGADGMSTGLLEGQVDFSNQSIGEYRVEIFLADTGDLRSNTLSKNISIAGGFAQASNYKSPVDLLYLG